LLVFFFHSFIGGSPWKNGAKCHFSTRFFEVRSGNFSGKVTGDFTDTFFSENSTKPKIVKKPSKKP